MLTIDSVHPSLSRLLRLAHEATAKSTGPPVQTLSQLRKLLGVSPQVMNAWKSRGVSKAGAIDASRLLQCPVAAIMDDPAADWMQPQHTEGGLRMGGVAAHEMGLRPVNMAPVVEWESIIKLNELPTEFHVILVDDAMAPKAPKGTKVRIASTRQPAPGDAVLVIDSAGALYLRVFHAGRQGQWQARPTNDVYPSLDFAADGLRVLGVLCGIDGRWSQLAQ